MRYTDEEVQEIKKSPWNFFINHPRVASLLILIILIWGFISLFNLPRELQPEVDLPYASIVTVYPGASPADTELLVTDEIEAVIKNVEDIDTISSSSQTGISMITIQFETGTDLDTALNDLRSAVDTASLPDDANDPSVASFDSNQQSVITFSLLSDLSKEEIKKLSEEVEDELKQVDGVSEVIIIGAQDEQIVVNLKQDKLAQYGLSINDVVSAIQFSNITFPIGEIKNDGYIYGIRIDAELKNARELREIPIKQLFGQDGINNDIRLKDIATIEEKLEESTTIARIGINKKDTIANSVSLQIYKKKGGNIVRVAESAKEKINEIHGTVIPESVEVHISNDNSVFIQEDLQTMGKNGITTVILIMILLFIFLGWKEAAIAGMSIPFAMLITFGVLYIAGESLNGIALFSLVFALGLLIDNAVIIIEGIYENLRNNKYTSYGAAILGIHEFKWPIIAGTLTTVFAFLPMLTISGIMGDYMSVIPITVTVLLLASLFVNLSITPTLASRHLKVGSKRNLFDGLQRWYRSFITDVIKSKSKKTITLIIMICVMAVSFSLPITGILKTESFPISDFDYFFIDIETPPGTVIEETEQITARVESILLGNAAVKDFTTNIGTNAGGAIRGSLFTATRRNIENIANITVNLVDPEDRDKKSYVVAEDIRQQVKQIQGADIMVTDLQGGPPSGAPIFIELTGPDLDRLEELSGKIKTMLQAIEGTLDVDTSIEQGAGEFVITVDRTKLNYYGIAAGHVGTILRGALEGTTATEIRKNGTDIDVIVQYELKRNGTKEISLDDLKTITVPSPVAGDVPLGTLVNIDFSQNVTSISHLDTERAVYVSSFVQERTSAEIIDDLLVKLENDPLPQGYTINYGGELEEITESFKDLGMSLIIGLILIAMLLVLQFKSYRQPFIILLSLPFALTGVFFGLAAMNITLSIPSVIGIVGLAGVVVNDAIVLIDQMNNNRRRGMKIDDAIIEGAVSRLQPVFLTTATSIFGILPLALTDEIWGSLGFAFIFGLTTQYFLVLLLDPILYSLIGKKDDVSQKKRVYTSTNTAEPYTST
ncbi:MMPL family transporter [Candidatus Peregrinibacteria bacterium]|nr:MMPL family transporter [Candidatus Peregrinibacteria bacterium]